MPRAKTPSTRTTSKSTTTTAANSMPQERKSFPGVPVMDLENQIRQRAYELYQERGCTPGRENDDWFTAEREVLARNHHYSA